MYTKLGYTAMNSFHLLTRLDVSARKSTWDWHESLRCLMTDHVSAWERLTRQSAFTVHPITSRSLGLLSPPFLPSLQVRRGLRKQKIFSAITNDRLAFCHWLSAYIHTCHWSPVRLDSLALSWRGKNLKHVIRRTAESYFWLISSLGWAHALIWSWIWWNSNVIKSAKALHNTALVNHVLVISHRRRGLRCTHKGIATGR